MKLVSTNLLKALLITSLLFSLEGCNSTEIGGNYIGRWECTYNDHYIVIKPNDGNFFVTDEAGQTNEGTINKSGTLVLKGWFGVLPLPIDKETGLLSCSNCGCKSYKKK